jgi:hypothetical protein
VVSFWFGFCVVSSVFHLIRAANDFFMNPPSPDPAEAVPKQKWDESNCRDLFNKYREKDSEDEAVVQKKKIVYIYFLLLFCNKLLRT